MELEELKKNYLDYLQKLIYFFMIEDVYEFRKEMALLIQNNKTGLDEHSMDFFMNKLMKVITKFSTLTDEQSTKKLKELVYIFDKIDNAIGDVK